MKVMLDPEEGPVLPQTEEDAYIRQGILDSLKTYQEAQSRRRTFREGAAPAPSALPQAGQPGPVRPAERSHFYPHVLQKRVVPSAGSAQAACNATKVSVTIFLSLRDYRRQQPTASTSSGVPGQVLSEHRAVASTSIRPSAPPLYPPVQHPSAPPLTELVRPDKRRESILMYPDCRAIPVLWPKSFMLFARIRRPLAPSQNWRTVVSVWMHWWRSSSKAAAIKCVVNVPRPSAALR